MNLVLLFIIPLDRHDQTSGYSTCYKENALLNLMGNSSEWKMNFKYPCYSFPFPYLPKTKNRYLKDFTKIAKFLIKSFKKPKKKQAWILKKCLYKLLPLLSPEKKRPKCCFFKANYTVKSWSCNCQHYVNIKEFIFLSICLSIYLSIYLTLLYSFLRGYNSHLKHVTTTYNIHPFLILGI